MKKLLLLIIGLLLFAACSKPSPPTASPTSTPETTNTQTAPAITGNEANTSTATATSAVERLAIQFKDVTSAVGIKFKHHNGAFGQKYLPETLGSGCAFLDYDNDGWQDLLFINAMAWPGRKGAKTTPALYHNQQDGTFVDVTRAAKLDIEMYGMGCAIGDYDNDGYVDIFISCLGNDYLFHNLGNGSFEELSTRAGVSNTDFSTSAAWLDYDKDGLLDLFVCNYVEWSIEKDLYCTLDGKSKSYCKPESYKGQTSRLYRNRGNGSWEDVTQKAGLWDETGKALGITVFDYDRNGWPDLFVANDTQPNKLYRNNRDGTFSEQGVAAGVAFSEAGVARAGMGTDSADYDGSGFPSLMVGNFSNEMLGLYHNEGSGLFIDEAAISNIGQTTLLSLTFGCFFYDYDLDGREDIFLANGHVADDINKVQPQISYAQPPKLFRNLGQKEFTDVSARVGLQRPMVARGAAYADYDNDGDLDMAVSSNNGYARLFKNEGGNQNHLLRIKTIGTKSNRDGIGALVVIKLADGTRQSRVVKSGSSYCSQSELPLTFGLGSVKQVSLMEIAWPSGTIDKLTDIPIDQEITIKEGNGIQTTNPLLGRSLVSKLSPH